MNLVDDIDLVAPARGSILDLDLVAHRAQGGMRDAISLLELCAGGRERITPEVVNDAVGSTLLWQV